MGNSTEVSSLTNPRVKAVVKLRQQRERRRTGLLIAEGYRQVDRALEAGLVVRALFICPALSQPDEAFMNRLDVETQVFGVTDPVFKKMAYLRQPEGVLAVVEQPAWSLDRLPTVSSESLFLVAVGTQKPGNLGAMVRTAAAAGCTAVLAAGPIVDAFNPNAICSSTGAVYDLPTVSGSEQLVRDYLQNHGVRMLAACLDGPTPHRDADWTGPVAVVIGPEDRGLSESWLEAAKASGGGGVSIRMQSGVVDSLNAGVAAAVLLFEARR